MRRAWIGTAALACIMSLGACGPGERAFRRPRQTIVAVDLSNSQDIAKRKASRDFAAQVADSVSFGDDVMFMEMNRSGVSAALKRYPVSVLLPPDSTFVSSSDRAKLAGTKDGLRQVTALLFEDTTRKILHTDVLSTLFTAGEHVRLSKTRPSTLILLSDMLQSDGGIEMEGARRMPPPGWIAQHQANHTIADLNGVCVVVVGADASTAAGARVFGFWEAYFKAAGADFRKKNYVLLANGTGNLGC
jgi:hypothetical protein